MLAKDVFILLGFGAGLCAGYFGPILDNPNYSEGSKVFMGSMFLISVICLVIFRSIFRNHA